MNSMKVALISPAIEQQAGKPKKDLFGPCRVTLPYLAALLPEDWDVTLIDESVHGEIDVPSLIKSGIRFAGISPQTASAKRAYAISQELRGSGVFVAMGGVHVSLLPREALEHCDAVVVGEAESVLPKLIDGFKNGTISADSIESNRAFTAEGQSSLERLAKPRWDLMGDPEKHYMTSVETARGCPNSCIFCSVHAMFGKEYRCRPIEDVVHEVAGLGAKRVFFSSDNVYGNKSYARDLFEAVRPLGIPWLAQASSDIADDESLVKLASECGCKAVSIGFETLSPESLPALGRKAKNRIAYIDVIKRLHDHGIAVGGGFIFGFDFDKEGIADELLEFCHQSKIESVSCQILTPYPGTRLFGQYEKEGRLIARDFPADWARYDTTQVVYKPKLMSVERLYEEASRFRKGFFSHSIPFLMQR